jgi:Xaa-Pro aminopeptidase
MFQSFEEKSDPTHSRDRIPLLRHAMERAGVDGFLVPRADEHQGEYVAPRSERLQWLTGFTGSAGVALVLKNRAVLFVDGRYTLQAAGQIDPQTVEIDSLIDNPPPRWLRTNATRGLRLGIDPWLHTISEVRALRSALEHAGAELVMLAANLVDGIWPSQPAAPASPVMIQPLALAGELASDKLARMAQAVGEAGATHTVLTDPSSLAWTFNIRGSDVAHTPLALGFAIVGASGRPLLYLASSRLDIEVRAYLTQLAELREPSDLARDLERLSASDGRIGLDPSLAADRLRQIVEDAGGTVVEMPDPARLPRAMKNPTELQGARSAHLRDGAAVVRFLHWLSTRLPGTEDEISAVRHLEGFRATVGQAMQMPLREISFDTISGSGPNGAIIHYRVSEKTNRKLGEGELFLVDSGAQFQDGTTDITRTVAIGTPTDEMRRHYTLVLKGLIAISLLRFPAGTRGMDIDPFARQALWQAGLDYAHGTGHGVGSYLAVHEGPQRIARTGTEKLLPGMILSNEPGYYRRGEYGIRLENLIVVTPADAIEGGEIDMHGFETLTLAPFDRRLILVSVLETRERDWLNAYHARVRAELAPLIDGEAGAWLEAATAPL